jgi:two-component system response regulator HydG
VWSLCASLAEPSARKHAQFSEGAGGAEVRGPENRPAAGIASSMHGARSGGLSAVRARSAAPRQGGKELREALARVAASPRSSVLVRGPLGTPLAEHARAIHAASAHAPFPLVELSPGIATATEVSALLARAGRGSLLVPALERVAPAGQAALAALLERRSLERDPARTRILAVLEGDADAHVASGALREDLLYRLNGSCLRIPELRERSDDLILAAARFEPISREARAALLGYAWPANERELELVLQRARLLAADAPIGPEHLGLPSAPSPAGDALPLADRSLRAVEEALIRRVLAEQSGNKSRAAAVLGLHRATLHQKIRDYGIGVG